MVDIGVKILDWGGKAVVGVILSALLALMARVRRRRSRRAIIEAITGLDPETAPLAVVGAPLRVRAGSTKLTQQSDGLPVFGYGPFVSFAVIATRLLRGQSRSSEISLPEIVLGSQFDQLSENDKRDRDLLLLGYPAGNEASRILEPLMKLPVRFGEETDRGLILNETGEKLVEPDYVGTGRNAFRTKYDYGLVARVRHPLNPTRNILYLAGCETFGVKIAAESLRPDLVPQTLGLGRLLSATWQHSWLPTLGISKVRRTEWVAVWGASVEYLATGSPTLICAWIRTSADNYKTWQQVQPPMKSTHELGEGSLPNAPATLIT